ncbi:MAG: hypothetical protein U0805_15785 [Pirellulales bacterium]
MTVAALPFGKFDERSLNNPLSAEHRRELALARDRARVIRKTARVASFNGWTTAIIAALSTPFSLTSLVGLAVTAGIALVAFNEFRGRKRLLNFEPSGPTLLGWNQVGFLAMITVYCLWMMYTGVQGSSAAVEEIKAVGGDLDAVFASSGGLAAFYKQFVVIFYGAVIGLSVLFQGGTALYYFSRRRHVEEYVAETPEWVRDVLRSAQA